MTQPIPHQKALAQPVPSVQCPAPGAVLGAEACRRLTVSLALIPAPVSASELAVGPSPCLTQGDVKMALVTESLDSHCHHWSFLPVGETCRCPQYTSKVTRDRARSVLTDHSGQAVSLLFEPRPLGGICQLPWAKVTPLCDAGPFLEPWVGPQGPMGSSLLGAGLRRGPGEP